jgi:hypothetical protein
MGNVDTYRIFLPEHQRCIAGSLRLAKIKSGLMRKSSTVIQRCSYRLIMIIGIAHAHEIQTGDEKKESSDKGSPN